MKLHEYQAKELLAQYGVISPLFFVASSTEAVAHLLEKHPMQRAVLKIQVHAGGRKKAGGVTIVSREKILEESKKLIGMKMVNAQTGEQGIIARKIMISEPLDFLHEYYLGIVIDRRTAAVSVIVSKEGGVDIEEAKQPPLIETIDETRGLHHFQLLRIAESFGWPHELFEQGCAFIHGCVKAFFALDAELLEINPLVLGKDNTFYALDAKMVIDDNALFRHPTLAHLEDLEQLPAPEREARINNLAYVALNGTIGCMVNGAGLAMATMDLIRVWGKEPANFLDVGGGASQEKVIEGLKILLRDSRVKAILVNIFGGIMDCLTIAEALVTVAKEMNIHLPIVVRMEGTNSDAARTLLQESKLPLIAAATLEEAAQKVVGEVS